MSSGLDQLRLLAGEWITESKKYSEGRGRTKVAPTEGGKFLRIESRGVYRVYRMTVVGGVWKMWRQAPRFNQRYTGKISGDGKTIAG